MAGPRVEGIDGVVIVGAGPAGLVAATTLAAYGVPVTVLEKRASGSELPRATVASTRTMELMRSFGLADQVRAAADDVTMTLLETVTAREAHGGTEREVGYPTPAQAAVVSPERPLCIPQDDLEAVLLRHLAGTASVRVLRGLTVRTVTEQHDAVLVLALDEHGDEHRVTARWVIGADGARSVVRTSLGVQAIGPAEAMAGSQTEVRAPLWDLVGPHRHGVYAITHPDAPGVLLPAGHGDRWIYATDLEPGSHLSQDEAVRRIRIASGLDDLPVTLLRHRQVHVGAHMATAFRTHHTFLVGDAAHRVTPRGGTGMNTAIAGAHNLAWKLAWVHQGWAEATLLDTYELERRVIAEHNYTRSLDPRGSRRAVDQELAADLGDRVRHLWLDDDGRTSTLDVLGPGLTLLAGPQDRAAPRQTPPRSLGTRPSGTTTPPPVRSVEVSAFHARLLGLHPGQALVLRPDGALAHTQAQQVAS